jgi:L-ascorbate metabolism protein UlaG (beta-lactamase superfamily)
MKITKLEHSCLLVEMPAPVNRTVLFDPGAMSEPFVDVDSLEFLDDIVITHIHGDHFHLPLVTKLVEKFPDVRITAPQEVADALAKENIKASATPPEGMTLFDSPHESVEPMFPTPQEIGVHYLDKLSHPGDSHGFTEAKEILALPMTAPWGSMVKAVNLALELQPKHILPIHDWHWKPEAKDSTYDNLEKLFKERGITFHKLTNGEPIVIDL